MAGWAEDPELLATFRAEVEDRLASLSAGLLRLEDHPAPRQVVAALFRDAHTVKGSARMLSLDHVVAVAHRCEDLLGAVRDGRVPVRTDVVDVLLVAVEAVRRALPGADRPLGAADLAPVLDALAAALAGEEPVQLPVLPEPVSDTSSEDDVEPHMSDAPGGWVRVPARRVHGLLDVVGEAELVARRVGRDGAALTGLVDEHRRLVHRLRTSVQAAGLVLPEEAALALHALAGLGDRMGDAGRVLAGRAEESQARLEAVREASLGLAMVPVRRVVTAFEALVRELAGRGGKQVRLVLEGQDVELDARVLDAVADALRHLVTNAVDHGCETPAERTATGKPAAATVTVSARAAGASVVVEVADDGRGVDEDALRAAAVSRGLLEPGATDAGPALLRVLFAPGFSTRAEVSETSGRGVGLDVVSTSVQDLGGTVDVTSAPGEGTRFTIVLPVTLGVVRCLLARVGEERYALPVPAVVETVSLVGVPVHEVAGTPCIVRNGRTLPVLDLGAVLGTPGPRAPRAAVVVRWGRAGEELAWAVDRLEDEVELVVKELGGFLGRLPALPGATIDGDGRVVLLLDVRELAVAHAGSSAPPPVVSDASSEKVVAALPAQRAGRARVLVVEDSVGVRELQRAILESAGYDVVTAVDGLDGAARLSGEPADLVVSDVEMPGMDGFTLTRQIRRTSGWSEVPVVIMTSRGDDADRRAGLDAGANAYLLKSEFDQAELLGTVRRLVGR
ncbi:MAG TPA: response regulator [Motilibacteraceae bacterium]|nr:response regulator [Motilibacteraceae bacterium]